MQKYIFTFIDFYELGSSLVRFHVISCCEGDLDNVAVEFLQGKVMLICNVIVVTGDEI